MRAAIAHRPRLASPPRSPAPAAASKDDSTPVACLEGAERLPRARSRAAPGEVKLGGETPISDCLAENQEAGDLATVGDAMVEAATKLNAEARDEPGGGASLAARLPDRRRPARAPTRPKASTPT